MDIGSSYLPSELNAAYLYAQLEMAEEINENRLNTWDQYHHKLKPLQDRGLDLTYVPEECEHNAHMFYIKVKDLEERNCLIQFLKDNGVNSVFHYIPLHSSSAGRDYGYFCGGDKYTTRESERVLRLPMYYGLREDQITMICNLITEFFLIKNSCQQKLPHNKGIWAK